MKIDTTRTFKNIEKHTLEFHEGAEIYDALNNFDDDIPFWKKWCKKTGNSVLELCCGTGRVGIPLLEAGFDYVGVDYSKSFLKSANKKAFKKLQMKKPVFIFQDIRKLRLGRKFDSIIIPFNAFAHMFHYKDAEKCFAGVKKHLNPGGLFIVDMFNPNPTYLVRDPKKKVHVGTRSGVDGLAFEINEVNVYDKATQINHIRWFIKLKGKKKIKVDHLFMRLYYPQEYEALLHYNGFKIFKRFGGWDESEFCSDSRQQVVIAKIR